MPALTPRPRPGTYFIHTGPSIYPWGPVETYEWLADDFDLIQKAIMDILMPDRGTRGWAAVKVSTLDTPIPTWVYRLSLEPKRAGSVRSGHILCLEACLSTPPREELKEVSFLQHNLKGVECPYRAIAMIAAGFRGERYA